MAAFDVARNAWELLDRRSRRNAVWILGLMIVSALSAALMVGSVLPFLTVLSDPSRIQEVGVLSTVYTLGGFETDYGFLIALGAGSALMILISNLLQVLRTYAVARFAHLLSHDLSHRLFARYLRQPYEFFLDRHTGTLSTRILSEAQQVVASFYRPAADAISACFVVLAIVILLIMINPVVALTAFILFGGTYCVTFLVTKRKIRRQGRIRAEMNSIRFQVAAEALGGVKDIKIVGREATYVDRYITASERMARTSIYADVLRGVPQYVMQTIAFSGIIMITLVMVNPEELSSSAPLGGVLPLLGVFAFAGQRIMPELSKIYQGMLQIAYGTAAVTTIHRDFIATGTDGTVEVKRSIPIGLTSKLSLQNVSYRYPEAERAGLHGVSLTIGAGEKVGVVGSTGSGKTTLADLLLGLLRPEEGQLVVDGTPVTDDRLRSWQDSVGYVPQDVFLTDATVAENIAFGIPEKAIDHERVIKVCMIAQIDDFIRNELPLGYSTFVGERGVRLSGGQRQRIGIARALYHDADLIVFDEATSALDNMTEREVMAAINGLPGQKTIVMVAHRLSTVRICHRIVVLDQGRVAGIGSWDELMETNSMFRKIAKAAA